MSRIYVQNETEDANNSVFNMKTTINESRTLRNQISCECKFKFDGRKCNSNPKWYRNKCYYECKNPRKLQMCEKIVTTKIFTTKTVLKNSNNKNKQ